MTTAIDKVAGPIAQSMIRKFGKRLTLTRVTEGTYNPATSSTTNTTASETVYGVVEEYTPKEFAAGMVAVGDKKVTLAAQGITEPSLADKVTVGSKVYNVVAVGTIFSGDNAALYILQVRA